MTLSAEQLITLLRQRDAILIAESESSCLYLSVRWENSLSAEQAQAISDYDRLTEQMAGSIIADRELTAAVH